MKKNTFRTRKITVSGGNSSPCHRGCCRDPRQNLPKIPALSLAHSGKFCRCRPPSVFSPGLPQILPPSAENYRGIRRLKFRYFRSRPAVRTFGPLTKTSRPNCGGIPRHVITHSPTSTRATARSIDDWTGPLRHATPALQSWVLPTQRYRIPAQTLAHGSRSAALSAPADRA